MRGTLALFCESKSLLPLFLFSLRSQLRSLLQTEEAMPGR